MDDPDAKRIRLSKSILEMKFMKRTKEKVEKQIYQEEGEEYFGSERTTRMKEASGRYIFEPSFIFCEELRDGRVSYNGMNAEIERLMELEQLAKLPKADPKKEVDVSDEHMAKQWKSSASSTIGNKFKTKRERNQRNRNKEFLSKEKAGNKPKFLKPKD